MPNLSVNLQLKEISEQLNRGLLVGVSEKIEALSDIELTIEQMQYLSHLSISASMFEVATQILEKAVKKSDADIQTHLQLVSSYIYSRRHLDAKNYSEYIISKYGPVSDAFNFIGMCCSGMGDFESALDFYKEALKIEPANTFAIAGITKCRKFSGEQANEILEIFQRAFKKTLSNVERARVHYAIAKIHNDDEQFEKAWSHALNANTLMRLEHPFVKHEEYTRHVDNLIKPYSDYNWKDSVSDSLAKHVLVVGMPRSGTTLIEQILSTHKDYYAGGEVPALEFAMAHTSLGERGQYSLCTLKKNELNVAAAAYEKYFNSFGNVKGRFLINKVPKNYLYIGFFKQLFPRGKVVFMERDCLDVVSSIFFEHFSSPISYTTNISDILHVMRESERVVAFWRAIFPHDILVLKYENLINRYANEMDNVSRLLETSSDEFGDHTKANNAVETPSIWQVRQGVYKTSIGRWRRYSALRDLALKLSVHSASS